MKFRITGADRDSGEDMELLLEAADAKAAYEKASRRGVLVADCHPESDHDENNLTAPSIPEQSPDLDLISLAAAGQQARARALFRKKPHRSHRFLKMTGLLLAIFAAIAVGYVFLVAKPQLERIRATFSDAASETPSGEQVRANSEAAAKNLDKEAAVAQNGENPPPVKSDDPPPGAMVANCTIDGDVWVKKTSGEVLPMAAEEVLLLPMSLTLTGSEKGIRDGIDELQIQAEVADKDQDDPASPAKKQLAQQLIDAINPSIHTGVIATTSLVQASSGFIDLRAGPCRNLVAAGHAEAFMTDDVERDIDQEPIWHLLASNAISTGMTDRNGQYKFNSLKPGNYVIACRVALPPLRTVVYWSEWVQAVSGKDAKVSLSGDKAIVTTY